MARIRPSRLQDMVGIGVDRMGDAADAATDPELLRLENMDTDLRPLPAALDATREAVDDDAANSYLPFPGHARLRAGGGRACPAAVRRRGRLAAPVPHLRGRAERDPQRPARGARARRRGRAHRPDVRRPAQPRAPRRRRAAHGAPRADARGLAPRPRRAARRGDAAHAGAAAREPVAARPATCSTAEDWRMVATLCNTHDLWLIDDAAHGADPLRRPRAAAPGGAARDVRADDRRAAPRRRSCG